MFNALSILRELFFPQWIRRMEDNETIDMVPATATTATATFIPSSPHQPTIDAVTPTPTHPTASTYASTQLLEATTSALSTLFSTTSNLPPPASSTSPVLSGGFADEMVFSTADIVAQLFQNITYLPGITAPVGFNNFTLDYSATTHNSTLKEADAEQNLWALILILFPILTIFGNTLVILSVFRERSLQTATNYFIVSLACADLLVAAVVMPFAVYIEVNNSRWFLGDTMCDTWVATDVIASTCSIFNLTAISIDRYIAVTKPLKYARHKNHRRVVVTICVVWAVSCTIGLPMILGLNTPGADVVLQPNLCMFNNSDFIIYSSLCSFFIPCVLMTYLYWRIFGAIQLRAQKAKSTRGTANHNSFVSNTSKAPSSTTPPIPLTETSWRQPQNSTIGPVGKGTRTHGASTSFLINGGEDIVDIDLDSGTPPIGAAVLSPTEEVAGTGRRSSLGVDNCVVDVDEVLVSPDQDSPERVVTKKTARFLTVNNIKRTGGPENGVGLLGKVNQISKKNKPKDHRRSMKSREKQLAQRERKATKTLAIVLGVFLACWVPFFTANMVSAVLAKLHLPPPGPTVFMMTTWLGYANSFMNPVIYTVFNEEFRKAFQNILSCSRKHA